MKDTIYVPVAVEERDNVMAIGGDGEANPDHIFRCEFLEELYQVLKTFAGEGADRGNIIITIGDFAEHAAIFDLVDFV